MNKAQLVEAIADKLGGRQQAADAVDAVLRTIYDAPSPDGPSARRNVVFTSSAPDVCAALNWKQPNCAFSPPALPVRCVCAWIPGCAHTPA